MNQAYLSHPIAELVDELAVMPGALAVVLGGSRALGAGDAGSDWDLGLYYRGRIDLTALAARGVVHAPGSWGRIMNGEPAGLVEWVDRVARKLGVPAGEGAPWNAASPAA